MAKLSSSFYTFPTHILLPSSTHYYFYWKIFSHLHLRQELIHNMNTISTNGNTKVKKKYIRSIFQNNKNVINNKRHLQFVNFHFAGQKAKILDNQFNIGHSEAGWQRKVFLILLPWVCGQWLFVQTVTEAFRELSVMFLRPKPGKGLEVPTLPFALLGPARSERRPRKSGSDPGGFSNHCWVLNNFKLQISAVCLSSGELERLCYRPSYSFSGFRFR